MRKNDVLSVLSPAPSAENNKQSQSQYDGLGRVTKSCAIGNGSTTSCGQNTGSANGVTTLTSYTSGVGYQTVSSTRGSQTRSQTVDGLGRATSSTTPEGGTASSYYDTVPSFCVPGNEAVTYPGKLIATKAANGNFSCYGYDALGRTISIVGNYSGGGVVCRRFYYDNSSGATGTIPSGITINNPYGRMVEAMSNDCTWPVTASSIITDEWFSYDKYGHTTDIWEMTPHSGIYYHSLATFAGNGVPLSLQLANPNLYSLTYGLDGEGRPSTLKEGTETIVAGTTFNASGQPTYIDLGTGTDQSDYIYDPSTGRMTNWTFQVGSASETGALGWNANGTLKTLAINDGFNAGGTQNCNINPSLASGTGYDDLGRLVGVDCGSGGWGQTFSYDQYDNLTKSVISGRTGIAWNPGYNAANNHYSSGASYDNSGNLTNDSIHLYTWDQFNKLSSIDSSACATNGECVTYDALGRAVETSYDGVYTEIWYTQLGKAVYMQGSTPYYAYFPTPGGGTVEVNGNAATNYYMHKDWLGNSRVSSTVVSHTAISDQAYAPFGEVYDKLATGASTPGQMFTGDVQNIISGIVDTPNRELNASQGRWISPDPALAGWNQYAYVNNNPMSYVDPSGLACQPLEKKMFGTCTPFMNNGVNFGFNWNEFDLFEPWDTYEGRYSIINGLSFALAWGNTANNNPCAAGQTMQLTNNLTIQSNAQGTFTATVQLTGPEGGYVADQPTGSVDVFANTTLTIGYNGALTVSASPPIFYSILGGVGGAYISSFTYDAYPASGTDAGFTQVNGTRAIFGIPLSSSQTPSAFLLNELNQNPNLSALSNTLAVLQNIAHAGQTLTNLNRTLAGCGKPNGS